MSNDEYIERTAKYVSKALKGAEAGHDWFHVERVWKTSRVILENEPFANPLVVNLAALLHDIADSKFHQGDEELGPQKASHFLHSIGVEGEVISHVIEIIRNLSFKNSFENITFTSKEMEIVQDADRLDAIGAIGIARAFHYGGYKNRLIYDPAVTPHLNLDKATYKGSTAPTLNHFYEKLLHIRDRMNTNKGKDLAKDRHAFLEQFLKQFYEEWEEGKNLFT